MRACVCVSKAISRENYLGGRPTLNVCDSIPWAGDPGRYNEEEEEVRFLWAFLSFASHLTETWSLIAAPATSDQATPGCPAIPDMMDETPVKYRPNKSFFPSCGFGQILSEQQEQ